MATSKSTKKAAGSGAAGAPPRVPVSTDFAGDPAGHPFTLRFVSPPDGAARAAIAEAIERAATKTLAETPPAEHPFRWAGARVTFRLFESPDTPPPEERGFARFFRDVEAILAAVHVACPIAEAAETDAAEGEVDPAFEAARAAARASIAKAAAKRGKQVAARGGVGLVPVDAREIPPAPAPPAWAMAACRAIAPKGPRQIEPASGGAWVALLSPDPRRNLIAILLAEGAEPRLVEVPRLEGRAVFRVRPDGAAALYAEGHDLREIDVPSGRARALWQVERTNVESWVEGVYLPGDRIGVVTRLGLHVLRREGDALRRVDFIPVEGEYHALAITADGRALVATTVVGKTKAALFALRGDEIRPMGTLKQEAQGPFARGDRLFADSKGKPAEIVGLAGAWEAAFAEARASSPRERLASEAEARRAKGEPRLVPIAEGALPPAASPSIEASAPGEPVVTAAVAGAEGATLVLTRHGDDDVRAAVIPAPGAPPRDVGLPRGRHALFAVSPDGARAIVAAVPPNDVFEVSLSSGDGRFLLRKPLLSAAYLAGDRLALADPWSLDVYAMAGGKPEKIASASLAAQALTASGSLLFARSAEGRVTVLRMDNDGLSPVTSFDDVAALFTRGGRLFATVHGVDCAVEGLPGEPA